LAEQIENGHFMEAAKAPIFLEQAATSRADSTGWWRWLTVAIAVLVLIPLLSVIYLSFFPEENIWPHLIETVLPRYLRTTFWLMLGVGTLSTFFGLTSAWLVAHFHFPGKKIFTWALLLPFAVPAYVIAYVYTDLLEYSGTLQGSLRVAFGWTSPQDYWFPQIRSVGGAIIMFSLVLYPYIYLTCRAALQEQSESLTLASRSLGSGTFRTFRKVILPTIRPALAIGLALTLMETLNDYGTVSYFAVQTLTAGLYDTWLNLGNLGGAAQIATLMICIALLLLFLERKSRKQAKTYQSDNKIRPLASTQLAGWHGVIASVFCLLLVTAGFIIPAGLLLYYAVLYFEQSWTANFAQYALNSLKLSSLAALVLIVIGTVLAYAQRIAPSNAIKSMTRLASVGYAMPGAVLAIGVIIPLGSFDNWVDGLFKRWFDFGTGLLLSGTIFAIVYAYSARFLTVSLGSAESGLSRITPTMDQAARTLGHGPWASLRKIHLPLLRRSLLAAAIIVFVDCMKELPATLILRPFNFETLATFVYQFASDELLEQSALAALMIVIAGLLPVLLLNQASTHSNH